MLGEQITPVTTPDLQVYTIIQVQPPSSGTHLLSSLNTLSMFDENRHCSWCYQLSHHVLSSSTDPGRTIMHNKGPLPTSCNTVGWGYILVVSLQSRPEATGSCIPHVYSIGKYSGGLLLLPTTSGRPIARPARHYPAGE